MRITFVIQDLFQQGAEYVTALMARGFAAKGYEVDILVSKIHTELIAKGEKPFEIPKAVRIIEMPAKKARNNISFLIKYLRKTDSAAVVAMQPTYLQALALAGAFKKKGCILGSVEHGGLGPQQRSIDDVQAPSKFSANWLLSKLASKVIDCFMAVSDGTGRVCEKALLLPTGTVKTVYNPVIDDVYRKKVSAEATEPWITNKATPIVCAAGAFCALKDHYTLFKAIKQVNQTMPVKLVLFGKGSLEEDYRKWISKNGMADVIKLAGHTSQLPAEIKQADVFVCSSWVESFSVVLIEALATGVPVVSTSCCYGPPEILKQGKYGRLVPVADPEAMAEAIIKTLKEGKLPIPEEAWRRFELERIVDNYEKALGLAAHGKN